MRSYKFGNDLVSPEMSDWRATAQKALLSKVRLACTCVPDETRVGMYIAKYQDTYLLKRLPFTGPNHAPACDHYEPPPELSGLGQVAGAAIHEDWDANCTVLSLDFALTKGQSRSTSPAHITEHESVRSDGTKLTMRGLLHYLFDEAGLTRWVPAMSRKRSWFIVRRELLKAAEGKVTKGKSLLHVLYVPETFSLAHVTELKARRATALLSLNASNANRMILIAEVKAIEAARFGQRIVIKHVADMPLFLNEELAKRLRTNFARQLELWGQLEGSHLLIIATISQTTNGVFATESACLMNVNEEWIPFESSFEYQLLAKLHSEDRRFVKGLRYNLPATAALAAVAMQDTGEHSTALYVIHQGQETAYEAAIKQMHANTSIVAWTWLPHIDPMPALPAQVSYNN